MMRILHLEDDQRKADLIHRVIAHLDADIDLVSTWKAYQQALVSGVEYDAIVSDQNVPMFPGQDPKNLARATVGEMRRRIDPETPILFISGDPDYAVGERLGVPMFNTLDQTDWLECIETLVT